MHSLCILQPCRLLLSIIPHLLVPNSTVWLLNNSKTTFSILSMIRTTTSSLKISQQERRPLVGNQFFSLATKQHLLESYGAILRTDITNHVNTILANANRAKQSDAQLISVSRIRSTRTPKQPWLLCTQNGVLYQLVLLLLILYKTVASSTSILYSRNLKSPHVLSARTSSDNLDK